MTKDLNDHEPGVLRVFQSKDQTKAYHNEVSRSYDLPAEHAEQPMRAEGLAKPSARPGAAAGFDVAETEITHMWVPVEIVHAIKPD